MDLTKSSQKELVAKCEELGITKCKSKNKSELIELINSKITTVINSDEEHNDIEYNDIEYNDIEYNDIENYDNIYKSFEESIPFYENNPHYKDLMCLKDTTGPNHDETKNEFMVSVNKLRLRDNLKHKCVLPLGHDGKCCHNFNILFQKNKITDKLITSISTSIYSTPGNDDYIYKNRASRLYENVLSSSEEKKIRDKNQKKKCAIPLKDASSPELLAQAYLDWMTYMINIKDMSQFLNFHIEGNNNILSMINRNKEHLISVFNNYNRKVFDNNGYSICAITGNIIEVSDVSDPTRDNRVIISDNDIQLGHNCPRTEKYVSIRGENLIPMSRRGNLIIGERIFTEDIWIDELKRIVNPYI